MVTKELINHETTVRKITLVTTGNFYTCQFIIEAGYQCIIGRADKQSAFYPKVDLTDLGGYRMGVSRTHAILELIDNKVYITDKSSNGTEVNGRLLKNGEKIAIENHSDLKFGELNFHIYIQQV